MFSPSLHVMGASIFDQGGSGRVGRSTRVLAHSTPNKTAFCGSELRTVAAFRQNTSKPPWRSTGFRQLRHTEEPVRNLLCSMLV
jgi:hypothetical protein